ncbi:hypothetical protein [Leisingera sp. F5]|uniref:hypothetical protein n=1 Tax=Leisingera sp. F5 TaxID=1813816 RepID=UPI000A9467C4|nr:hypothetical protein [Leisingera sp. F5]
MRIFDSGTSALLAARGGLAAVRLVWISARNRSSGQVETIGLCSAEDDLTVQIGAETRTYSGAGGLLQAEPITAGPGLSVRVHQLQLSAIAPEVEALVKGYDTRFAPVEIHRALLDPSTRLLAGEPHRVFRGMINAITFPRAEAGGTPSCSIEVVSETRVLTRTLGLKKSHESHKARGGDKFRQYGNISGSVPVYWGEQRIDTAPVAAAPAAAPEVRLGK